MELGAGLEQERAWSLERLEPDPRRTQVGIFFLCLFCLFICGATLHKIRSVAVQLHKQHLLLLFFFCATQEVITAFSCCGATAALLHAPEMLQRRSTLWSCCSVAPRSGAAAASLHAPHCSATPRSGAVAPLHAPELLQCGSTLQSCYSVAPRCGAAAAQFHTVELHAASAPPCCGVATAPRKRRR